ncbi:MAG: excinuclease ABC subunit UvrA [Bacteroidales bacterium]|nr:excinuclease ABC subunit UvrA [Bacteroidales bacterium]
MSEKYIKIKGTRVNNLKNVDVELPRGKFIVISGLSGSGKSSLAFDTLYAEGRRRYVESLSAYARQFLGKMTKPECDYIKGLPPAVAIEQKVNTRNPRSTVGTSTEIYDYMRLLFGRVGRTYSPVSGQQVKKHTVEDVIAAATAYPDGTRVAVVAPVTLPGDRDMATQLDILQKEGFTRLVVDGSFVDIDEAKTDKSVCALTEVDLLIDRLAVAHDGDELSRLAESTETAFFEGHDRASLLVFVNHGVERHDFSKRFEADGMTFAEPSEQMFNFNNPYGACPVCEGFGKALGIDEGLVVPDQSLSVYDDAVAPWRGPTMSEWKRLFIRQASPAGFPVHRPYSELTDREKSMLWDGVGEWPGINGFFAWMETQRHKVQYRVMYSRFRAKTTCPECHGSRLRRDAMYVKVGGCSIAQLVTMPASQLLTWFENLRLDGNDARIAGRLLTEIRNRLGYLVEVGLGYLTLDRLSNSLSGGESQRINLATSLGSSLVGSLYILDEPSIGLHPRDTDRLIGVLRKLQGLGNTVVVVEHDEEIIRAADMIIDVGPDAGRLGGEIVYQGPVDRIAGTPRSYTAQYLSGDITIPVPSTRRPWRDSIEITHATEHNLKDVSVRFPLGVMTVVTGVSGSGKSTLVRDILYKALARRLETDQAQPGRFGELRGDIGRLGDIVFVDQNPIGKSSRSNPATYLKAYDEIRELMSQQQHSRQMGFTPAYFSFNTEGGRCEECKGEGYLTIPMQFLADVIIPCEACGGKRFKREVLEVSYRGCNISDILDMTVDRAIEFFGEGTSATERRIVRRLQPLHDVGLGYIKLGQSSSTLSGGENQRVKLASFLADERPRPTMFIFDEPTTGLHFHDIHVLMDSFNRLIAKGHTLVIIEHNLDVIKCADHVIDLGPDGGDAGGNIVAEGTPEHVAGVESSITGRFLKNYFGGEKN